MPFDEIGLWRQISEDRLVTDADIITCQATDSVTNKRCMMPVYPGSRKNCQECGILLCIKHFTNSFRGHIVCFECRKALVSYRHTFYDTRNYGDFSESDLLKMDSGLPILAKEVFVNLFAKNIANCLACTI